MADYHIYIHNATDKTSTAPKGKTTPKSAEAKEDSNTIPSEGGGDSERVPSIVPGSNIINSALRFGSSLASGSVASAAFAAITLAVTIAKEVEKAGTAVNDYVASQTGDYSSKIAWDNAVADISNTFHPISSSINAFLAQERYERSDKARAEERSLFGDAQLNVLTKGV